MLTAIKQTNVIPVQQHDRVRRAEEIVLNGPQAARQKDENSPRLTLVFDFDGVIADSSNAMLLALNLIGSAKKAKKVTEEEFHSLSMRQLLKRVKVRWYERPYWVSAARAEVRKHANLITLQRDVLPVLAWAQQASVPVAILSSNSEGTIRAFLQKYLPDVAIPEVVGDVSVFGKHRVLRKMASRMQHIAYVGDEVRDIEAAHRAGVTSIAVTWGKDSDELLRSAGPQYCVDTGEALLRTVSLVGQNVK